MADRHTGFISLFFMLTFLDDLNVREILAAFNFDPDVLATLWDMPEAALAVIRNIYEYEATQAHGQSIATNEEKFKYLRAWPLEMDAGVFLYLLVRYLKPQTILECGTSFGVSALFEASALQQNKHGHLTTVEVSKLKHDAAWQNFQLAQVEKCITQEKVAFDQYLKHNDKKFDLVLLDCDRSRYPVYFEALISRLNPNALLLVDNAIDRAADILPFRLKLEEKGWFYSIVPVGDGLLMAQDKS